MYVNYMIINHQFQPKLTINKNCCENTKITWWRIQHNNLKKCSKILYHYNNHTPSFGAPNHLTQHTILAQALNLMIFLSNLNG